MEITRLNIISDFVSPISRVPQVYASFWKWGALLFAIFATCTSLFARIKLYLVRLHAIKHSSSVSLHDHDHLQQLNNDSDLSDNDYDDDNNLLSPRESVDEKLNSKFAYMYDDNDDQTAYKGDQDYSVAGSYSYRDNKVKFINLKHQGSDNFDLSELFTTGKSVVKQWDNLALGLGLGLQENFTSKLSIYDTCRDENVCTFMSESGNGVKIGAYDRRIRAENPVMYAEWASSLEKVVGLSHGGVEKVYVKHGGACTVGDMRNFRSPLKVFSTGLET
ncbi:hypothetical protein POM88_027631 [Heracleum sosnowskyi]|uniref:Uncharacterized protein n=1 Tax=Heracleum sosnowskyi TaxID=360622 RepID=A0AAD8I7Z4_9APIA|nr:hypothetical protein POM88_027631 [Heracleum sosnowskyi]